MSIRKKNRFRLKDDEIKIIEEYRGLKDVAKEQGVHIDKFS